MSFQLSQRVIYTLKMSYHYRHALATIYLNTPTRLSTTEVSLQQLHQQGIKVLVLDFDGVLAAHGEVEPSTDILHWLQLSIHQFEHVFLLSNKPFHRRLDYFKHKYPHIYCITHVAKKPYPEGLDKIKTLTGKQANEIALVDDRLLTGVLATCIAQTQVVYITLPYKNIKKRPLAELFFIALRFIERRYVQFYAKLNK